MDNKNTASKKLHIRKAVIAATLIILALAALTALCVIFYHITDSKFDSSIKKDSHSYKYHYAFIGSGSSIDDDIYEAAYKEGLTHDAYVEYMGKNLDVSYTKTQLTDISVSAGVDGIIVDGDETEDLTEAIYTASQKNIPVITAANDCSGSARQSYVGISYYALGQEYGRQIARSVSDKTQTVLILMSPNSRNQGQNIIYSGIRDYLADSNSQDKFMISTQAVGDGSIFSSEEDISDIFNGKDLPDIMICLDETNTTCACQAIVDYNRVGDTMILGYYQNETILNSIDKKILSCTFTVDPSEIGAKCVDELDEYISTGRVTEYTPIDTERIDDTNVAEYLEPAETEVDDHDKTK